jgi:hypothetical protein
MKAKFRKLRCIGGVARVGREIIHCNVGVQTCWKALTSEDEYVLGVNDSMELKVVGCGDDRRKSHRIVSIGGFSNTVVEPSISTSEC